MDEEPDVAPELPQDIPLEDASISPSPAMSEEAALSAGLSGSNMPPAAQTPTLSEQDPRFPEVQAGVSGANALLEQTLLPTRLDWRNSLPVQEIRKQAAVASAEAELARREVATIDPLNFPAIHEARERRDVLLNRAEPMQAYAEQVRPRTGFEQQEIEAAKLAQQNEKFRRELNERGDAPGLLETANSYWWGKVGDLAAGALRAGAPETAQAISEAGGRSREMASINTSASGKIGRGIGEVAFLAATMGRGGLPGIAAGTLAGAVATREQVLRETGSPTEADKAALESYPALALYMLTGSLAAKGAAALVPENASKLTKGLAGFAGAEVGNVAPSVVIRALNNQEYDLEAFTADTLFAAFHGIGEYRGAVKAEAAKRAKTELKERGWTDSQIENMVPSGEVTPAAVVRPPDETVATPISPETSQQAREAAAPIGEPPAPTPEAGPSVESAVPRGIEQTAQEAGVKYDGPMEIPGGAHQFTDQRTNSTFIVRGEFTPEKFADKLGQLRERYKPKQETPAEIPAQQPEVTGIRNAIVNEARVKRGLPEREAVVRRSFGPLVDEANAIIERDPNAGRALVDSLKSEIRPLKDSEDALLTVEQTRRENALDDAVDAVNSAKTPEELDAAQQRLAQAENDVFDVYQYGQDAGTANARGLNARKILMNRDYTLARMVAVTRAKVNEGKPLTEAQRAEVTQLHDRIKELEAKAAKNEVDTAKADANAEFTRLRMEMKKEAAQTKQKEGSILNFFDDQAQKARDRIKARRGRLNMTIDPLNLAGLADEVIIGASYVARGVRDLAQWSAKMVEEFGGRIRPYLDSAHKRAVQMADENRRIAGEPSKEQILADAKAGELNPQIVYQLTRKYIREGVDDFGKVIKSVTADLAPTVPELSERQVMDALSGYGKISTPSKKADLVKLREFKTLARLTSQLQDAMKGIVPLKTGKQRDKATQRVRELQQQVNEARKKVGIERVSESEQLASGLDASKTRIRNEIQDLQSRIQKGDYTERVKREPLLDREKINLQFELQKVRDEFNKGLIEARRAKRSAKEKVIEGVVEGANLARQIMTSADLPPVFRQGLFSIGRPVMAGKAVVDSLKAMFSEKHRFKVDREIQERPNAPLYSRAKLFLAKEGSTLSQQEEAYMGNWFKSMNLKSFPNLPLPLRWAARGVAAPVGAILRGSERAYNTFLNKLRADTFDAAVKAFDVSPVDTATLRRLGDIINTMTGRGTLPGKKLEQSAAGLNTFLFAPRFMASRFKLALGEPLWTGNAKTRKFALEQYGRTLAGIAVIYSLAKMAGYEIETDPRSSNFGKIKVGNTYLDPLGGLSQVTTFLTRVTTGETKTQKGEVVPLRETMRPLKEADRLLGTNVAAKGKPKFGNSTLGVIGRFLRTKLNPITGASVNLAEGKDMMGQPATVGGEVSKMALPISYQDILETMQKQGVPRGAALTVLSLFGMGIQNYGEKR